MTQLQAPLHQPIATIAPSTTTTWWQQARIGLFIHWGPYAALGGAWQDQPVSGCAEHIRRTAPIARQTYRDLALGWNPTAVQPAAWVDLAREAGLGYIVFTSKHHDGFCLWDSPDTNFTIARGALQRDIMAELRAAADAADMPLGWYYSPRDWDHPDFRGDAGHPDLKADPERDARAQLPQYLAFMQRQCADLIKRYGPVATLWFDGQDNDPATAGTDALLAHLRALAPQTLINDRIGSDGYEADYAICEGYIPGEAPTRPWETCLSLNYNWGFCRRDQRWCGAQDLIRKACETVGNGGNFLINIGPDGDGHVPQPAVDTLRAFGRWMQVHRRALCGTTALPTPTPGLRYTRDADAIYALVLRPQAGELRLPGLWAGMAPRLLGGDPLRWRQDHNDVVVTLPALSDGLVCVVELPEGALA